MRTLEKARAFKRDQRDRRRGLYELKLIPGHDIFFLEATVRDKTVYPASIYLITVPTSASLMKSARRRTTATPRIPHPPKNKTALALKTINLMKLFRYPMVSCEEVAHHNAIGPKSSSSSSRVKVGVCMYVFPCVWLSAGWIIFMRRVVFFHTWRFHFKHLLVEKNIL